MPSVPDPLCARCALSTDDYDETCWYCSAPLCSDCWDDYGHCGHEEAVVIDEIGELTARGRQSPQSLSELIAMPRDKLVAMRNLMRARLGL